MNSKKITINLQGGLGNQLFQIFSVINLGKRHNMDVFFPNVYNICSPGNTPRHTYYHLFPKLKLSNDTKGFQKISYYVSDCSELILSGESNILLESFFQSYKNLSGLDPYDYIQIPPSVRSYNHIIISELREEGRPLVSLHVRRSDYLKVAHFHGVMGVNYFKNAIQKLKEKGIEDAKFLIFSDDIKWCMENLGFIENKEFQGCYEDYAEMFMMAECDHNIIANSSFSWWGAYLNMNPNKIVIYPEKWFQAAIETPDLCPPDWIPCPV